MTPTFDTRNLHTRILRLIATCGASLALVGTASAQAVQETQSQAEPQAEPRSFQELLDALEESDSAPAPSPKTAPVSNLPDSARPADRPVRMPGDGLPMPYDDTDYGALPWMGSATPYLVDAGNGALRHTLTAMLCPATIDGALRNSAQLNYAVGHMVRCAYADRNSMTDVVMIASGSTPDADAIITNIGSRKGGVPQITDTQLDFGGTPTTCREGRWTDPGEGTKMGYVVCKVGAVSFRALLGGTDGVDAARARLGSFAEAQTGWRAHLDACIGLTEEIAAMAPSGATGRALMAESFEYEPRGRTCYQGREGAASANDAPDTLVMSFPDNPDTPMMWLKTTERGALVEAIYLQHAYARQEEKATKPAVYNLVREGADGKLTVYDAAYSRVLPVGRFLGEIGKVSSGELKPKLDVQRNAAGGMIMMMK